MSTTNSVSASLQATMNNTTSSTSSSSVSETEDRFLKLLVAQMQNQNPLNPLDNSEVTSQMAQLSTVTGINQLNDSLDNLLTDIQSSQALEAADMIGHGVFVSGSSLALSSSQGIFGVDLPSSAESVTVTIYDSSGNAVSTMDLGSQDAGMLPLIWDGATDSGETAPDGQYTFEIEATSDGETLSVEALSYGQVTSVTLGSSGVQLNIADVGAASLSDIREIL